MAGFNRERAMLNGQQVCFGFNGTSGCTGTAGSRTCARMAMGFTMPMPATIWTSRGMHFVCNCIRATRTTERCQNLIN